MPLGFGAIQIGSELSIAAIRLSRIRGKFLRDRIADLSYDVENSSDVKIVKPAYQAAKEDNPKYLPEMIASSHKMADAIKVFLKNGRFPVILSSDHSCTAGTFSGLSSHFHERHQELGLIWFDAHTDVNTPETSPSGNINGMSLAILLGRGNEELVNLHGFALKLNPKFCIHFGARDLDISEKRLIGELGLEDNE